MLRLGFGIACWLIATIACAQPALLPVPEGPGTAAPCCPTPLDGNGQPLVYDRSLLYIPDQHPSTRPFESRPRDERATWGRAALLLGQTQGLLGLIPDWRSGVDAAVGVWWDPERSRGAEAGVMYLGEGRAESPGQILESRFFSAHIDYRHNVGKVGKIKFDILTGYRFASVGEDLSTRTIAINTGNQFHGGTIGIAGELRQGPWSLDGRASVAFGATFAKWNDATDRSITTLPEVALTLGREILDGSRVFVGYRLAYLDKIGRPNQSLGEYSRFNTQGVMVGFDWWF